MGRHVPRVDAALAIAAALDANVVDLFGSERPVANVWTGESFANGQLVRAAAIGDRLVATPVDAIHQQWDVADGVASDGTLEWLGALPQPGLVVVGCEPGMVILERLLRNRGAGALAALSSNVVALEVLAAGRAHAAVMHGPRGSLRPSPRIERFRIASWQVGLASRGGRDWVGAALAGRRKVIQREQGAGVQQSFETATGGISVAGPVVGGHLEAAERSRLTGLPAVTIEPAAVAAGLQFHPLATHECELWVDERWRNDSVVTHGLEAMASQQFTKRLAAIGGYDLEGIGSRIT